MSKNKSKKSLLCFAILTCGIHEHLLKTSFWSQECGNSMPGQDPPNINSVFTEVFRYHNSWLPFNKPFFFTSVETVIAQPPHRLFQGKTPSYIPYSIKPQIEDENVI